MRRGSIASLVGIGIVSGGVAAAVALALPWLPTPASREAGRIDFVFWFVVAICIFIFALVSAAILYSVLRFRAAPDDDSDGPPIHGHTGLEIAWTLIPTVLVTAIGVASAIVLSRDDALGKNVLRVNVTAQQFAWTFSYPDAKGLTSATLILPEGRSVLLTFTSKDITYTASGIHLYFPAVSVDPAGNMAMVFSRSNGGQVAAPSSMKGTPRGLQMAMASFNVTAPVSP